MNEFKRPFKVKYIGVTIFGGYSIYHIVDADGKDFVDVFNQEDMAERLLKFLNGPEPEHKPDVPAPSFNPTTDPTGGPAPSGWPLPAGELGGIPAEVDKVVEETKVFASGGGGDYSGGGSSGDYSSSSSSDSSSSSSSSSD